MRWVDFARAHEAWGSLDVVPPRVSIAAAHACPRPVAHLGEIGEDLEQLFRRP